MAHVLSLNVLHAVVPDVGGSVGVTSIDKRPVVGRRSVTTAGVAGDARSDVKYHGHTDQAVYAYGIEDYEWWSEQLGRQLDAGIFGENLTTIGIDWNAISVGTVVSIGSATLQVSCPRIPCATFQRWIGEDQWVKRFNEAGRWSSYLRVLEAGELGAGDEITIISTPGHDVSIWDLARVYTGAREVEQLNRVAQCADTPESTREKAISALANM